MNLHCLLKKPVNIKTVLLPQIHSYVLSGLNKSDSLLLSQALRNGFCFNSFELHNGITGISSLSSLPETQMAGLC